MKSLQTQQSQIVRWPVMMKPWQVGKALVFPKFVLNGPLAARFKGLALPAHVVYGFQSHLGISRVMVQNTEAGDYLTESLGDRTFVLGLPYTFPDYGEQVSYLTRGLSAIAAQNRVNLIATLKETLHDISNAGGGAIAGLQVLGLVPGLGQNEEQGQLFQEFEYLRDDLAGLKVRDLSMSMVDSCVRGVKHKLQDFLLWEQKTRNLMAVQRFQALQSQDAKPSLLQNLNDSILPEAFAALDRLPGVIERAMDNLDDLGRLDVITPITLAEVALLNDFLMGHLPEAQQRLREMPVMANKTILEQIFDELIRNATRAAQAGKREELVGAVDVYLKLLEKKGCLQLILVNKVNDPVMRKFLKNNEAALFAEINDADGHGKQKIFQQGVTSRAKEEVSENHGGIGLSLLWDYVVLRLKGRIHADYSPEENEFMMMISFQLVDNG
ncbi:MAG: hypothetical protein ABIH69_07390 [bacterium]|nr:hypothetical protein [Candidatus Margulisiibacteriota bacterium]